MTLSLAWAAIVIIPWLTKSWIGADTEGSGRDIIPDKIPKRLHGQIDGNWENPQFIQSLDLVFNPGYPDYERNMLTTRPRLSGWYV